MYVLADGLYLLSKVPARLPSSIIIHDGHDSSPYEIRFDGETPYYTENELWCKAEGQPCAERPTVGSDVSVHTHLSECSVPYLNRVGIIVDDDKTSNPYLIYDTRYKIQSDGQSSLPSSLRAGSDKTSSGAWRDDRVGGFCSLRALCDAAAQAKPARARLCVYMYYVVR